MEKNIIVEGAKELMSDLDSAIQVAELLIGDAHENSPAKEALDGTIVKANGDKQKIADLIELNERLVQYAEDLAEFSNRNTAYNINAKLGVQEIVNKLIEDKKVKSDAEIENQLLNNIANSGQSILGTYARSQFRSSSKFVLRVTDDVSIVLKDRQGTENYVGSIVKIPEWANRAIVASGYRSITFGIENDTVVVIGKNELNKTGKDLVSRYAKLLWK